MNIDEKYNNDNNVNSTNSTSNANRTNSTNSTNNTSNANSTNSTNNTSNANSTNSTNSTGNANSTGSKSSTNSTSSTSNANRTNSTNSTNNTSNANSTNNAYNSNNNANSTSSMRKSDNINNSGVSHNISDRPQFPKRAVITGGMPYGNKDLHLGHIGGVFVHADMFSRFLRDRIGKENVIFISGTDCYGSPIQENYRQLKESGSFKGTMEDFVMMNHSFQKEVLDMFNISLNSFFASSMGRAAEIHREVSSEFINKLYTNGFLRKMTTSQFYDTEFDVFLNGRQVIGQCPIAGCKSEKGYADECSLGHQYMPADLINPKSTLSGQKPEMRDVTNWYFKLDEFNSLLKEWVVKLKDKDNMRNFAIKNIEEFLEPPVIYIKKDLAGEIREMKNELPDFKMNEEENKSSFTLIFDSLDKREKACEVLTRHSIRYRTGKTLVPFRLTGNIEWGVPAPGLEGLVNLTVWVWPESLWAPVSFTRAYLEQNAGSDNQDWKDWWCSEDAKVYQFIGEDNIYFYGPVEMAMFMASQGTEPVSVPPEGELHLPELIVNNHLLFLDKKASSSGEIKPPMARELLNYYTAEQLRAHFLGLGLGIRSVSFSPKPLNPKANERDGDPVLKEGNLLSNVFNRAVRSCFYTTQKYYEGIIPCGKISNEVLEEARSTVLEFEKLMYKYEFHQVMNLMDTYIRNINKYWAKYIKDAEDNNDDELRRQTIINTFHMVRTAAVLMHPIAPEGTEMILDYLNIDKTINNSGNSGISESISITESFWSWDNIFEPVYSFMEEPNNHMLKFLESRVDFFKKHPSQF